MGVHGSAGATGVGASLPAAARLAAMSCCPPAAQPAQPDEGQAQGQGQRAPVRGGGPGGRTQHGPQLQHQDQGPHRLEQALHQRCQPGGTIVVPPLLLGGGAPALVPPGTLPPGAQPATADPALVALAVILTDAMPGEREPSALRQLGSQLATLLASTGDRLRSLLPTLGAGTDAGEAGPQLAAPRADAPTPLPAVPLQPPPPPPGPTLTLDPTLGTIVLDETATPNDPGTSSPLGTGGDDDDVGPPTNWLPIAGYRFRFSLRGGLGSLADRIGALLRETGITRMQLLLLTIATPLVVGLVAYVVDAILAGR